MTSKHSVVLGVTASLLVSMTLADVKVGLIGSLSSDTSLNTLHGAEIATEEISAADGTSSERLVPVNVDTDEGATEGVEAYEYLAETEEADFIISGSIDDAGLGWLPRMQKFQTPMLDIWIPYIGIIGIVIEDPETMAPYFTNITSDEALAMPYINFGVDTLKKEMGWDGVVILAGDTAFGEAITDLITEALGPIAGIEIKEIITYDVSMVDLAPLFSKTQASGVDFIYQVGSMDSQVISSQYAKLQVPMAMTGMNVSALGLEYWGDTGGAGGGISTLLPIPSVGFELDPESRRLVDTYQAKYDGRLKMPHLNGFDAYRGLKQAVAAAGVAGGFDDVKAWSAEMKKQDIAPKKGDETWLRYAFWGDDEVEEVTDRTYPHNARFDLTASYGDAQPSTVVVQWKEDGEVGVVYPPEYVTIRFIASSWVK